MKTAYVHLRVDPHYRLETFVSGLTKLGFHIELGQPSEPMNPEDVAIIWNRSARSKTTLEMAARGGGAVIVAENGYWGRDVSGRQAYALALDFHNGAGRWFAPPNDFSRLNVLQIEFLDRPVAHTTKVVVAGQRGIGLPPMASPGDFGPRITELLRSAGWDAFERPHPGRHTPAVPLSEDLKGAKCLVVWASNCATEALIAGVPVIYMAPTIITAGAARPYIDGNLSVAAVSDVLRLRSFQRLACAQAFIAEIESGEALDTLLLVHSGVLADQNGIGT